MAEAPGLGDALSLLRNAVAEQNNRHQQMVLARAALEQMPDDVPPERAMSVLRSFLPASSAPLLRNALVEWWEEGRRGPVLAALAGLWQEKQPNGLAGPGLDTALRHAGPELLGSLVTAVESRFSDLDGWFGTGTVLYLLEAAAVRNREHAALGVRLDALVPRVSQRTRLLLLERMQRLIAEVEAEPEDHDGRHLALVLRTICLPRFPELMEEAQAVFVRHGEIEWRLGAIDLDLMVVEHFAAQEQFDGLEPSAIARRLCRGLMDEEALVSEAAALALVRLIEQGHLSSANDIEMAAEAMRGLAERQDKPLAGHRDLMNLLEAPPVQAKD